MALSRLLRKYSNLKMNEPPTFFCLSIVAKTWRSCSPLNLFQQLFLITEPKSPRDKCVSDYVVNYEIEILGISLNFSTKVSLFSAVHQTHASTFCPHTSEMLSPRYGFRLSGLLFVLLWSEFDRIVVRVVSSVVTAQITGLELTFPWMLYRLIGNH